MKTFILEWFTSDSPYRLVDFQHDFPRIEYGDFEWKLDDRRDGIRSGDNFYMVKTGKGNCGVVMKGFFLNEPQEGKDGCYVSLRPLVMVHPDHPKGLLSTKDLAEAFPKYFSVYGTPAWDVTSAAETLDELWEEYLRRFDPTDYDGILLAKNSRPEAGVEDAIALASEALYDVRDHDGNPAIIHSLRVGLKGKTDVEKICGFLHEVLRDPEWTAGDLRDRGFSEEVVDTLLMITHRDGQTMPVAFFVDLPRTALNVCFADLDDNKEREELGETSEW